MKRQINKLIFNIRKHAPRVIKRTYFKIKHYGHKHYCNICNSNLKRFLPEGVDSQIFSNLQIVGGGYKEFDICPVCKASYRQRLIKLYLDFSGILYPNMRILQVAPEESLYYIFKKNSKKNLICGDLMPERYSYYAKPEFLDLTELKYDNNSFDLVVCNHVLEHIPDDRKAMREIHRVLTNNGTAILQVPVSLKLNETFEDSSITSEKDRLIHFGQRDHVRIYAMDYIDRLEESGFTVEIYRPDQSNILQSFEKLMLDTNEVVFIARKTKDE